MANANIKISQLPNIGSNLDGNTLMPVVSTNGTYITDKVAVGNLANFILTQAGNSFPEAFVSQYTYAVVNSAQPNITSVGNLNINTLHITGGINGYVLQTNGAGGLSWVAGGGSGNGEVGGSSGQLQFNNAGNFGGDPELTWDAGNNQLNTVNFAASSATIYGNVNVINVNATGNLRPNAIYTDNYYYANGYVFGGGGGNGVPGGNTTQVQFNDEGVFAGNTGFTFDKTTGLLSAPFLAGNGNGLSNIQGANVSGTIASATVAGSANSVAGANVSGEVAYAAVANRVAVANVVGLGNIATISLNGSSSQLLYGNGQWAAIPNTGDITFDITTISTKLGGESINIKTYTGQRDDNEIVLDTKSVNIYAYNSGFNSYAKLNLDNNNPNAPIAAIMVKGSATNEAHWTFSYDGILTLPASGGDGGGEVDFTKAPNSSLSGNSIVIDQYVDKVRFFERGGTNRGAYIDLSQAAASVGTLLNNRITGIVDAGAFVTMDNLMATITTSGDRGLSLATVSGTVSGYIAGQYLLISGEPNGGSIAISLTTTPSDSILSYNFLGEGDTSYYTLRDNTNNRVYRITLMVGPNYNSNFISIERLV